VAILMRAPRALLLPILVLSLGGWMSGGARPLLAADPEPSVEQAAGKAKETGVFSAGKDGFVLKSADGTYQLRLGALLQFDDRFWQDQNTPPAADTFDVRRARPIIEGTVAKYFDFRIVPDFGAGKTVLQYAYIDWRFAPFINLQAGKYKGPVGLERLQSDSNTAFVERALVTNLVPNRDVGLELHGDVLDGVFSYAAGIFNGVADLAIGDLDADNSKETAARVFFLPFKKTSVRSLHGLGIGVAATTGVNSGGTPAAPGLPTYNTAGQLPFFAFRSDGKTLAATTIADGRRHRISPQAYWYIWRFGFLTEYAASYQEVALGASDADLKNEAWQVTASFALTDDRPSFTAITPRRPFDPAAHHWGAVELAVRAGTLKIDEKAFPIFADPATAAREVREWGVGVNWYLNRNVKLMLDYLRSRFRGGDVAGDREDEKVILNMLQVSF
jgi:phosphate-selective porin OprO and OprP